MKIDRVLTNKEETAAEERLYKAIMSLRNLDEHRAFFGDIFLNNFENFILLIGKTLWKCLFFLPQTQFKIAKGFASNGKNTMGSFSCVIIIYYNIINI